MLLLISRSDTCRRPHRCAHRRSHRRSHRRPHRRPHRQADVVVALSSSLELPLSHFFYQPPLDHYAFFLAALSSVQHGILLPF